MIKIVPPPARILPIVLLMVGNCFVLSSCKKVEVDLGSDFVDNSTTNLVLVDSATVEVSTIYIDSFITAGTGAMLVGKYKDPQFGSISSRSFIQLGIPSTVSIPNGAAFDSLEVILKPNKNYYGDTLTPYSISVYQLTQPIKLPNEQFSFYNTNSSPYSTSELGSTRLLIRPATTDTISVPMSPSLGQELFDKMVNSDGVLANNDLFIDYFKGLAIAGGGNNNLVMGFKDSMIMRLHYRNPGVFTTDAHVDFLINSSSSQYNNISADRTGTPIAALGPSDRQIFSYQSQNAGYSQYISGAMVKLRFPYLRDLLTLSNFVKLIRADLVIKPVKNSFSGYYVLPPSLRLSQTDQYNLPGTDVAAYSSVAGSVAIEYGNLFIDNLYGTQTAYTYDITTYLQQQIVNTDINKNGLLVLPPDQSQIFNRVIIGDKLNKESQTVVKIYYATVK